MPSANTTFVAAQALPSDKIGASSTSENLFTSSSVTTTCAIPLDGLCADRHLVFKLAGEVNAAASENVTIALYAGSTIVSGNKLCTTSTVASGGAVNGGFLIEVATFLSSASKTLNGATDNMNVLNNLVTNIALSNIVTIDPNAGGSQLFCATATFSSSNASNFAKLYAFEIEVR